MKTTEFISLPVASKIPSQVPHNQFSPGSDVISTVSKNKSGPPSPSRSIFKSLSQSHGSAMFGLLTN